MVLQGSADNASEEEAPPALPSSCDASEDQVGVVGLDLEEHRLESEIETPLPDELGLVCVTIDLR